MKQTLINILETICPDKVFLQGTLNPSAAFPDEFITFWTDYTADRSHYDDEAQSFNWSFSVIFYSTNPARVNSVPPTIRTALLSAGFIEDGKGRDIPSGEPTHTGWAMNFIKIEYVRKDNQNGNS